MSLSPGAEAAWIIAAGEAAGSEETGVFVTFAVMGGVALLGAIVGLRTAKVGSTPG